MTSVIDVKNQVGPCGITCGTCDLGNGTLANTSKKTIELINTVGIKDWAPMVHGGEGLDWAATEKTLDWMTKYAFCAGCEKGGGSPTCAIRICANEKGFTLCNECDDLEACTKFDWLGDYSMTLKANLEGYRGKTKEEIVAEALSEA
jgi:hypothetical protein